ncbi:MAG TPA: hypothetical protein PLC48_14330 [Ferruginibacter sp.]|nr:hypothetical protein [Ferruginibacter sp.]
MQPIIRILLPVIFLFLALTTFILTSSRFLEQLHIDKNVLLGANVLFFLLTIVSFFIQRKGMLNKNPHVFVRSVTGGMLVKMVFCILAVIGYVYASGDQFNKRGVFIALFLYLVYLAIEVMVVMKMNKKHNA